MREIYSQHGNAAFEALLAARTATRQAAFFLPHLHAGMRVLDVGCGPGSITLGLAERVAPGPVVGVDIQPAQVQRARALAVAHGAATLRFEVADLYALPFADGSFDAAFAHGVLMHLREPARALAEVRRVLRPGGIVGIRDPDFGANLFAPTTALLQRWFALRVQIRQHNGGDPYLGRHHRRLLLEAGFEQADAGASVDSAGAAPDVRRHAAFHVAQLQGLSTTALAQGWLDAATVEEIAADFDAWAKRPDAFCAVTWCEAVGRSGVAAGHGKSTQSAPLTI